MEEMKMKKINSNEKPMIMKIIVILIIMIINY